MFSWMVASHSRRSIGFSFLISVSEAMSAACQREEPNLHDSLPRKLFHLTPIRLGFVKECLADADARARRNARAAERRAEMDRDYVERFAARVRELYPNCPAGREVTIAEHACLKYSGRVGRSAPAKQLSAAAVHLAVAAHVRHWETDYDMVLAAGQDRWDARDRVSAAMERVLSQWEK